MKVALIEVGGSHDECLYSQICYIKSDPENHLTLIHDKNITSNLTFYNSIDQQILFTPKTGIHQWLDAFNLQKILKTHHIDTVIFNTTEGSFIKKLLQIPNKKVRYFGTLHNANKVSGSYTQSIITKRIEKYFLLNDYLLDSIKNKDKFSSYYPIFFPNYPAKNLQKKENDIWICIPGQVELKRRDYQSLFDSIDRHSIAKNIKFILLGKCEHAHGDGPFIKKEIQKRNISNQFILWDGFIEVSEFYNYVKQSDYILPLIHNNNISYKLYKGQISGAFNLAIGYKKPMLIQKNTFENADFYKDSIKYSIDNLLETINDLAPLKDQKVYAHNKWSFDYQKERYLNVIKK